LSIHGSELGFLVVAERLFFFLGGFV
jgi:hypothetical protein